MQIVPRCFSCKNFQGLNEDNRGYKCKAFDIIPNDILLIKKLHDRPILGQKGDYVFEKE